jgi:hypothetical protein
MRMRVVNEVSLPVFIALTLSSCTTGPDSGVREAVRFTLDRTEYVAAPIRDEPPIRYEFQVIARIENQSDHTLYLARCFPDSPLPTFGVRLVAPRNPEGSAYDPVWACVGHDSPIVIPPGATRIDTIRISGPNAFQSGSLIGFGQLDGVFEFTYGASTCSPPDPCSPSQSITLRQRFSVRR